MAPGTTRDTPLRTFGRALLLGTKYAAEQKTEIRKSGGVLIAIAPNQALFKNDADFALIRERHITNLAPPEAPSLRLILHPGSRDHILTKRVKNKQTPLTLSL